VKILFSPSEGKHTGGDAAPISCDSFIFPDLYPKRAHVLTLYNDYIHSCDDASLKKLIGVKKEEELARVRAIDIFKDPTLKAIERYSGVAYEYLDYASLQQEERHFLDENLLIFSNLFGPILARDQIPWYKLKQGEKPGDFAIEKFYAEHFTPALDDYLHEAFVIDLRAGFYLKFYKLRQPHVTMKFIKNGKVVSHWAKAYRGMVVRELAKYRPQHEKMFSEIPFPNLSITEIRKGKLKTEYISEITV
jgi:cytoplasmic iron level regulating protein YaaA (DUF328/UPF0246 family)